MRIQFVTFARFAGNVPATLPGDDPLALWGTRRGKGRIVMLSVRTYPGAVAAALTLIAAATSFADAQDKQQDRHLERLQWVPEMRAAIDACMADRDRLCGNIVPGNGRIVRCLDREWG